MKDKKVLLMAPKFFGYHTYIKDELVSRGAIVSEILEDFSERSALYTFFFSKKTNLKYKYTSRYYKREIQKLEADMDYILVVRGEAISCNIMELLKMKYPNAVFLMYQWDSVENNLNAVTLKSFFDRCYTFDPIDAENYQWTYRPLFYIKDSNLDYDKKKYDFVFVGTLYYKRAQLLRLMISFCTKNDYKLFHYIFVKKIVYWVHKYVMRDKRYSILEKDQVHFKSLNQNELNKIYEESKIFVDYAADDQTGLTMRTIESIGHRCKIITNNKTIIHTDIYNKNNVFVYEMDNFYIPEEFVNSAYVEMSESIYKKYSICGWVDDVFGV